MKTSDPGVTAAYLRFPMIDIGRVIAELAGRYTADEEIGMAVAIY